MKEILLKNMKQGAITTIAISTICVGLIGLSIFLVIFMSVEL